MLAPLKAFVISIKKKNDMKSGLYQKYISKPVDLGVIKTKRHMMPNSYKEGDYVSEDDFEDNFKAKKEFPQYSVQDYSRIKKDKKGNSYVIKLKQN